MDESNILNKKEIVDLNLERWEIDISVNVRKRLVFHWQIQMFFFFIEIIDL